MTKKRVGRPGRRDSLCDSDKIGPAERRVIEQCFQTPSRLVPISFGSNGRFVQPVAVDVYNVSPYPSTSNSLHQNALLPVFSIVGYPHSTPPAMLGAHGTSQIFLSPHSAVPPTSFMSSNVLPSFTMLYLIIRGSSPIVRFTACCVCAELSKRMMK